MKPELQKILEDAGWYPERNIDIDYMISDLEREELTIPNTIIEKLLREFWNIELQFKMADSRFGNIRLNVEEALGIEKKLLEVFQKVAQEKMVPVGTINFDTGLLLASYSGKFYLSCEEGFYKINDNFFDSLESIIYQKNLHRFQ